MAISAVRMFRFGNPDRMASRTREALFLPNVEGSNGSGMRRDHRRVSTSSMLSDYPTFMLNVELSCRARDNVRLIYEDEILEGGSKELRHRHGWPVSIDWQGRGEMIWIIPDRLFGLQFLDRPKGKDTRYFAVEYDRGSMPVTRSNFHQSSSPPEVCRLRSHAPAAAPPQASRRGIFLCVERHHECRARR